MKPMTCDDIVHATLGALCAGLALVVMACLPVPPSAPPVPPPVPGIWLSRLSVDGEWAFPRIASRIGFLGNPLVVALLGLRAPSDITWPVITIIVDPIDGPSVSKSSITDGWSRADVSDEGFEAVLPFSADADTAASIIREVVIARIQAPSLHRQPRFVFRSLAHAVRPTGRPSELLILSTFTAARHDISASQVRAVHSSFCPAVTSTSPIGALASVNIDALQCDKTSKSLPGEFIGFRHVYLG